MATIQKRKRKDGTTAYLAQIFVKRKGEAPYREARTFDRRSTAKAWADKRTREIKNHDGDAVTFKNRGSTLADAVQRYTDENQRQIGRTKTQVLRTILDFDISDMLCSEIKSHHLVAFARELSQDRSPATVNNYMSHLSAVFAIGKPAWGLALDHQAMKDAQMVCGRLGVIGKARKRDRRPTLDELDALLKHFERSHKLKPKSMPMHKVIGFALFSTRRQEEITRIRWDGLDLEGGRVLISDMKHPGDKIGNDVWCDLPAPACAIAASMPRTADEVFPYNARTISALFTRACKLLEIEDLRFHDLRHEGITRLFEMGLSIPHVAAVSGHRSWQSLQRYTHIRQVGDKYDGWKYLQKS